MRERLPEKPGDSKLRSMTRNQPGTVIPITALKLGDTIIDNSLGVWMPDDEFVKDWKEYSETGHNGDTTPPPVPFDLCVSPNGMMTWQATADFESGLAGFVIEHNGKEVVTLPEKRTVITDARSIRERGTATIQFRLFARLPGNFQKSRMVPGEFVRSIRLVFVRKQ